MPLASLLTNPSSESDVLIKFRTVALCLFIEYVDAKFGTMTTLWVRFSAP